LRVAAALAGLPEGFVVLHDLHVPGSGANIDHLVLGRRGVWLIETVEVSVPYRWRRGPRRRGPARLRSDLDRLDRLGSTERLRAHAEAVSNVVRVPVQPLLCVTDPSVGSGGARARRASDRRHERPGPGAVAVLELDRLVPFLRSVPVPGGEHAEMVVGLPVEMDSLVRLARTLRTPTPIPTPVANCCPDDGGLAAAASLSPPATAAGAMTLGAPTVTPRLRTRGGPPRRRRAASLAFRSPALGFPARVAAVSLVALFAVAVLPRHLYHAGTSLAALIGPQAVTTTTVAMAPLDGPGVDRPGPPVGLGLTCPVPGAGWRAQVIWPSVADPTDAPAAIEVVAGPPDLQPRFWRRGGTSPPALSGLGPATEVRVTAQAIMADGTRLAPQPLTRTTPSQPC
jgi:hypothetical protein